ncbi:MAG: hypothetical protein KAJ15_10545, partial [Spirochaetes bacterium]|nr:hypothetical protein [Spirochaetota bacterium]
MKEEENIRAKIKKYVIGAWMWFAILLIWFLITNLLHVRPIIMPSVVDVLKSFKILGAALPKALAISMYMIIVGFIIGTLLGVGTSILMAYSKFARDSFT